MSNQNNFKKRYISAVHCPCKARRDDDECVHIHFIAAVLNSGHSSGVANWAICFPPEVFGCEKKAECFKSIKS